MKRPGSEHASVQGTDLAGALHEVSNSLTVVLGWLDAAKKQMASGAVHDAIEVALSHARLGHDIARRAIGAEAPDANVTRSALSVARDAVRGVEQEARRRGVAVRVGDAATDDLLISAAPVAQQILINLLLNGIHFTAAGKAVELGVQSRGGVMCFTVKDAGPGISPKRLDTLFRSPESTRKGGAGIGLRHAHGLAAKHGGTLGIASTGPAGSVFELTWPVGEAPSRAQRMEPVQSLDGLRILLLEDDPAVQALLELGLGARGAGVAAVGSLAELEASLARGVFDVALLDLSPLGDDPTHALDLIAARQPGLAVVVISGSVASGVDERRIAAWVRKPFEVAELAAALTALPPR